MKTETVTIVGLDKVGISLGLAIQASSLEVKIIGHDPNREWGKAAKEMGAVDKTDWNMANAVAKGDIINFRFNV